MSTFLDLQQTQGQLIEGGSDINLHVDLPLMHITEDLGDLEVSSLPRASLVKSHHPHGAMHILNESSLNESDIMAPDEVSAFSVAANLSLVDLADFSSSRVLQSGEHRDSSKDRLCKRDEDLIILNCEQ